MMSNERRGKCDVVDVSDFFTGKEFYFPFYFYVIDFREYFNLACMLLIAK